MYLSICVLGHVYIAQDLFSYFVHPFFYVKSKSYLYKGSVITTMKAAIVLTTVLSLAANALAKSCYTQDYYCAPKLMKNGNVVLHTPIPTSSHSQTQNLPPRPTLTEVPGYTEDEIRESALFYEGDGGGKLEHYLIRCETWNSIKYKKYCEHGCVEAPDKESSYCLLEPGEFVLFRVLAFDGLRWLNYADRQ